MPYGDSAEAARFTRSKEYAKIRAADAERARKRKIARTHYGGHGSVSTKRSGNSDPIVGFLKGAAKAVEKAVQYSASGGISRDVTKVAKAYAADRKEQFTHPRRYAQTHEQQMELSPGAIGKIIQAGGAVFRNPGKVNLRAMREAVPKTHNPRITLAGRRTAGDYASSERIPWLINNRTGQIRLGEPGASHAQTYPENVKDIDEWLQGWFHNPVDDYANIEIGFGRMRPRGAPYSQLQSVTGRDLDRKTVAALHRLLSQMMGPGSKSPLTDEMLHFRNPGISEQISARQGSRADDLLENLGGPMGHKEFNEFLQQELLRRKRK